MRRILNKLVQVEVLPPDENEIVGYPGLDNQPTGQGENLSDFPQKGVGPQ